MGNETEAKQLAEEWGDPAGMEQESYPTAKKKTTGFPATGHSWEERLAHFGVPSSFSHPWESLYKVPTRRSPIHFRGNWVSGIQ